MGKYKETPRYNVVSLRISDEEMATLTEMMRLRSKSLSRLLREAMHLYALQSDATVPQG